MWRCAASGLYLPAARPEAYRAGAWVLLQGAFPSTSVLHSGVRPSCNIFRISSRHSSCPAVSCSSVPCILRRLCTASDPASYAFCSALKSWSTDTDSPPPAHVWVIFRPALGIERVRSLRAEMPHLVHRPLPYPRRWRSTEVHRSLRSRFETSGVTPLAVLLAPQHRPPRVVFAREARLVVLRAGRREHVR